MCNNSVIKVLFHCDVSGNIELHDVYISVYDISVYYYYYKNK